MKTLLQILKESYKALLLEGGEAVHNVVRINQENVKNTLKDICDRLLPVLKLDRANVAVLGSTGKKLPGGTSGDVDLGIDMKKSGIKDFKEWSEVVKKEVEKLKLEVNVLHGVHQISIGWPIANTDGKQKNKFVQLDLMPVEDLEFNKFSKFTPQEQPNVPYYKSTIRNSIFCAMANVMNAKVLKRGTVAGVGEDEPVDVIRYHYHLEKGLCLRHQIRKEKKDGTYNKTWTIVEDKLYSSNPQKIIDTFFGKGHSVKDVETPLGAWDLAMKSDLLKDKERRETFFEKMREDLEGKLERQHITLPPEIAKAIKLQVDEAKAPATDMSATDSPRQSLTKIYQLTGTKLRKFLSSFINGFEDSSLIVHITPKVDGNAFRIGWINGKVYVENSGSGLVDASGEEISSFQKPQQKIAEYLTKQDSAPLFKMLKKLGLSGVKINGELLVSDADFIDPDGTITYVGSTYDATKLGKLGSMVVFAAQELHKNSLDKIDKEKSEKFIEFLCKDYSSKDFSYFNIGKFAQNIELKEKDFPKEIFKVLRSGDPADLSKKTAEELRDKINEVLIKICKRSFKNPDIMPEKSDSLEGVVFELDGVMYGINYESWKKIKAHNTSDIDAIRNYVRDFLIELTGLPEKSSFSKFLNTIRANPKDYQKQYKKLIPKIKSKRDEIAKVLKSKKDLPKFISNFATERLLIMLDKFADDKIPDTIEGFIDLVDGKQENMDGKTVCLIPGSFRPPHAGHLNLIKHYADIADKVIVGISSQDNLASQRLDKFGRTIKAKIVKKILEIYIKAAGLKNVELDITPRPMQWVSYKIHHLTNCKVILGVSGKDDVSRFEAFTTEKFKETAPTVDILPIEKYSPKSTKVNGRDISATYVRDHIDDKKALRKVLPSDLSTSEFDEVFSMLNTKSNESYKGTSMFKKLLLEGGHAFPNVSRINQENVAATVQDIYEKLLPEMHLTEKDVSVLGSTGKKLPGGTSGDIDLAIDRKKLLSKNHIKDEKEYLDWAKKLAKKFDVETSIDEKYGFNAVSLRWPIANVDGKQDNKFVQLDFVLPKNMDFVKWGMWTPQEIEGEENPKSAIRNMLFLAIGRAKNEILASDTIPGEGKVPVKMKRYNYVYNEGLYLVTRERKKKKNGEYASSWTITNKEFVTDDPDKITEILFGKSVKADDIKTVKEVWDALKKTDMWKDKKTRKDIERHFEAALSQTHEMKVPSYINFNESLKLEGEDSKDRVAVIITDKKNVIVGRSPQSKGYPNGFDLMKGHAEIGEDLETAAKREVEEECGLKLDKVTKISDKLKYSKGTTLTFFVSYMDELPDVSKLKCKSFFERDGKQFPEIASYELAPINELDKYLYKGLAKVVVDDSIVEKIMSVSESKLVSEGGNAVKDVVKINRKNVEKTADGFIEKISKVLKISPKDMSVIGSAGKKDKSGDIDIGVGKVSNQREFLTKAQTILNQKDIENAVNFGLNEISVRWPIENVDGQQKGEFVQIDLMPTTSLDFIKWGTYAPAQEDSKYKGVVRNLLLCDIAGFTDVKVLKTDTIDGKETPVEVERYVLSTVDGLYRRVRSFAGKKPGTIVKTPKTLSSKFITDDPDKIVKLLFGKSVKPEDCLTIDGLWNVFKKTPLFKDKKTRNAILKKTTDELKNRGLDYPSYMNPDSSSANESITDNSYDFLKTHIDIDKSTIAYLGNLKKKGVYFGPTDSLCEIHLVSKDGENKIDVEYKNKKWNVAFNGKPVKDSSKGYQMLTQSNDFRKLESKLFSRWNEMIKYPRRMFKNAQKSFASTTERKYTYQEIKTICKERYLFLKENFKVTP